MELLEELKRKLRYNKKTGEFIWICAESPVIKNGDSAGWIDSDGYLRIALSVYGKTIKYRAHRLAWLYENGEMPNGDIDHINGDRSDNRIQNLRVVCHRENAQNQKSHRSGKMCGAKYCADKNKWMARIRIENHLYYLGLFETELDAISVYKKAEKNGLSWVVEYRNKNIKTGGNDVQHGNET